jgi:hypothetical protein
MFTLRIESVDTCSTTEPAVSFIFLAYSCLLITWAGSASETQSDECGRADFGSGLARLRGSIIGYGFQTIIDCEINSSGPSVHGAHLVEN